MSYEREVRLPLGREDKTREYFKQHKNKMYGVIREQGR
jgi:hypothetical protein